MYCKKEIILFIGGSGFIGSHLINKFKQNYNVINVSLGSKIKNIKNIKLDLSKNFDIKKINKIKPDYIFFLLSLNHTDSEKNLKNSLNVNFHSLCSILQDKKILMNLKTFIYFSTAQVYGNKQMILSEDEKTSPKNVYGLTHLLCEKYLKYIYNKNKKNIIIYRVANSYGAPILERKNSWDSVINDFVKNAHHANEIIIKSHGLFKRNFIYIDDLVRIVDRTFRSFKGYKILNVGSFESISIKNVANIVKRIADFRLKKNVKIKILSKNYSKNNFSFIYKSKYKLSAKFKDYSYGIKKLFDYLDKK